MEHASAAAAKDITLIATTLQYVNKKVVESEEKVRDMIKLA